jgi:hypothetical protein
MPPPPEQNFAPCLQVNVEAQSESLAQDCAWIDGVQAQVTSAVKANAREAKLVMVVSFVGVTVMLVLRAALVK